MASSTSDKPSPLRTAAENDPFRASPTHDAGHPNAYQRGSTADTDGSSPSDRRLSQPAAIGVVGASAKRRPGPGSRGVANLTPEQLAKKRANDREAQRNIRERHRVLVEQLRARVAALESQQPYQELLAALREKEAVEAENRDIKSRLTSVIALIGPIVSSSASGQNNYPSPAETQLAVQQPPPASAASASLNNAPTPASVASPASVSTGPPQGPWNAADLPPQDPPSPSIPPPYSRLLNEQRHHYVHGLDMGNGERLAFDSLLGPGQRVNRIQSGIDGAQDSPKYRHVPMKHDWKGRARASSGLGQNAEVPPQLEGYSARSVVDLGPGNGSTGGEPAYPSVQIKNCPPTCPLDSLLLDFRAERLQRAAEGLGMQEIVGPPYPSVSSLLNPAISGYSHPLSKVFTDILQTFPDLSGLPERVATQYIMFLIMRWQISPSRENHDRLPDWLRPRPAQLDTPHPAWFDYVPFPRMRESLVRTFYHQPDLVSFDDFFIPFTTTLSVNWQYEDCDVLLQTSDEGELAINPVFERHLRRLDNWTLGDAFEKSLPQLRGMYNHRSESRGMAIQLAV